MAVTGGNYFCKRTGKNADVEARGVSCRHETRFLGMLEKHQRDQQRAPTQLNNAGSKQFKKEALIRARNHREVPVINDLN